MSRQQDFDKFAVKTAETISHQWGTDGLTYADLVNAGNECAEYGYQYAVEKAEEFLKNYDAYRICLEGHKADFVEQFRKAMQ